MVMDTMSDNVRQIAQRLSKTRRFSIDGSYQRKSNTNRRDKSMNINTLTRMHSESSVLQQSSYSPFGGEFQIYPDKIKTWMSRSIEMIGIEDDGHENAVYSFGSETGSDASTYDKETKLPKQLKKQILGTTSFLYDVPWDVGKCDLFIEVEKTLFPVEKNFITYVSEKFQQFIGDCPHIDSGNSVILKLDGYTLNELKTILTFIYSAEEEQITDQNVASFLQLADEFRISRLIYRCEKHLHSSKTFNPFIMSHLAKQYHLNSLIYYAYSEISRIENVEETQEFQRLDNESQNQILKFLLMRYKKASKTLSQFDVHLCKHHGDDQKNNQCCFRAATYSTENSRTYLISMENPEENLVQRFNNVLNCSSEKLLETRENRLT